MPLLPAGTGWKFLVAPCPEPTAGSGVVATLKSSWKFVARYGVKSPSETSGGFADGQARGQKGVGRARPPVERHIDVKAGAHLPAAADVSPELRERVHGGLAVTRGNAPGWRADRHAGSHTRVLGLDEHDAPGHEHVAEAARARDETIDLRHKDYYLQPAAQREEEDALADVLVRHALGAPGVRVELIKLAAEETVGGTHPATAKGTAGAVARWDENGHKVDQTQSVEFAAGDRVYVRFPVAPGTTAKAPAVTHG